MEIQKKITDKSYKIITRRKNGTLRVQTHNGDPSLTDQQLKDDTDVNHIMDRFKKTKIWPGSPGRGVYADLSEQPKDLLSAALTLQDAQDKFNALPSELRLHFNNNPHELISFMSNPNNLAEAQKLGLVAKPAQKNDDSNDEKPAPKNSDKKTEKVQAKKNNSSDEVAE